MTDPKPNQRVPTDYHCSTLVGNWEEERKTFGQPLPTVGSDAPIDPNTTYTISYKEVPPPQVASAKPPSCFAAEAPRELLFYHGDITKPEKNLYSVSELSYTDRRVDATTSEEVLNRTGVSGRNVNTTQIRSANALVSGDGEEERDQQAMRETQFLRSLNASKGPQSTTRSATGEGEGEDVDTYGYKVPAIPPVGRVEERKRLMTTKNVTLDSTGEYLQQNLEPYPLTSSEMISDMSKSLDNPMHRTGLRKP